MDTNEESLGLISAKNARKYKENVSKSHTISHVDSRIRGAAILGVNSISLSVHVYNKVKKELQEAGYESASGDKIGLIKIIW